MAIHQISDNLYVAPQLTQTDVSDASKLGIKAVICNRPDNEEPNQPTFSEVQQWLTSVGINQSVQQPVVASTINGNDVEQFQQLLQSLPKPVLAYCRTGTRSSLLWGFNQVKNGKKTSDVITAAQRAQINLSSFEERLNAAAQ